jgi:CHAT domain-containing protein
VAPDAALALIPFGALEDPATGQHLVRSLPIATLPSGLILQEARERGVDGVRRQPWRVAILGTTSRSLGSETSTELRNVEGEATSVAQLWPNSQLFLDGEATPTAWAEALRSFSVVHFAGHARAEPGAPGRAALWLWDSALGRERPIPASSIAHGPWPNLSLVVLSGCETALPSPRRYLANDGVAALFLAYGVPAVVATRWPISDRPSKLLFLAFHRALANGSDAATALQRAQVELLDSGDSSLSNPVVWAAAQFVGASVRRPKQ